MAGIGRARALPAFIFILAIGTALARTPWIVPAAAQIVDKAKAAADEADRAQHLMDRREYFEAFKAYKKASDLAGGRSAEYHLGMARALSALNLHDHVIQSVDAGLTVAADDARVTARLHSLKGLALEALAAKDRARLVDAEAEFRAALAADPDSRVGDLYYDLGVVLMKQGRDEEGIEQLKREIAIRPHGTTADDAARLIANPRRARESYAPDFLIDTVDGHTLALETLRGKVVLLDFWATWCGPCVHALPWVRSVQKRHGRDPFVVVSVNVDASEVPWREFVTKNGMTWPQCRDRASAMRTAFGVNAYPTYILLDGEGIIRYRHAGTGASKALDDAIDAQLKAMASESR